LNTLAELGKTDSEASLLFKSVKQFRHQLLKLEFGYTSDVSDYFQKDIDLKSALFLQSAGSNPCKSEVLGILARNSEHLQFFNYFVAVIHH